MAGIGLTILIAIISGALTGWLTGFEIPTDYIVEFSHLSVGYCVAGLFLKSPSMRKLDKDEHHEDSIYWETPAAEASP